MCASLLLEFDNKTVSSTFYLDVRINSFGELPVYECQKIKIVQWAKYKSFLVLLPLKINEEQLQIFLENNFK